MFSSIQDFISRHRRKFIFGGVFISGAFLLSRYGKKIYRERQERETKELFERNKKQQHYESVEGLCSHTALNMIPTLRSSITQELDTEELINNLRDRATDRVACWEQLKILSFTRVIALVYAASMLMVTLRIQLNLIGGYIFRDLSDEKKLFINVRGKYLSFCDHFISTGVKKICRLVKEKVVLFLREKSLKANMKLYDVETIFSLVQASIAEDLRDPCKKMSDYVLPEQFKEESFSTDNETFDQLVKDTKDLFESDDVSYSISCCIDRGKVMLLESLKEFFRAKGKNNSNNKKAMECLEFPGTSGKDALPYMTSLNFNEHYVDCSKTCIEMAKLIPIVNGLIKNNKNDMTEKWMLELIMMDRLKVMGANIYETFSSKYEHI